MGYCEEMYAEISDETLSPLVDLVRERVLRMLIRSSEKSSDAKLKSDIVDLSKNLKVDIQMLTVALQSWLINALLVGLLEGRDTLDQDFLSELSLRASEGGSTGSPWGPLFGTTDNVQEAISGIVAEYVPSTLPNRRIALLRDRLIELFQSELSNRVNRATSLGANSSLFGGSKDLRADLGHAAYKASLRKTFDKALEDGKFRLPFGYGTLEKRHLQEREVVVNGKRVLAPARTKLSYREGTRVLEKLKPSGTLTAQTMTTATVEAQAKDE